MPFMVSGRDPGVWFKRHREQSLLQRAMARVAIETDGDDVTVPPHTLWEPVK